LHKREFATGVMVGDKITDLVDARARSVEFGLNDTTTVRFTVAGTSPTAGEIAELAHDVIAWRWDDRAGADRRMALTTITQSQDTISEQEHTASFTCQDYFTLTKRRFVTQPAGLVYTAQDQDDIVANLLYWACRPTTSGGAPFYPASELNLIPWNVNPDGSNRSTKSGVIRDRTYPSNQSIYEAVDNLAHVQNGFDYALQDAYVRVYFPNQGVQNTTFRLEYGSTVSGMTRQINSANYGNYVRTIGQTPQTGTAPYGQAQSADSTDLVSNANGLWMVADSQSDVTLAYYLGQHANGVLAQKSAMVAEGAHGIRVPLPTYQVTLRPGAWYHNCVRMGDTVQLIVHSGRLDIDTWVRVVGITFDIGDDGQEDVKLTVGTPAQKFVDMLTAAGRRISALERRTY